MTTDPTVSRVASPDGQLGITDTAQKAFQLNLDTAVYGTLAEIGAGQEVARWFFRAGGASGTVAKTMSAYDMKFSDEIYGSAQRYVSRERLEGMLEREYGLILDRLQRERGAECRFFAFANTVATTSFKRDTAGHGWMGIRFQHESHAAPSEVIVHLRLLDSDTLRQQDTLGVAGVNLIFAATKLFKNVDAMMESLLDGLGPDRLEVDMIHVAGPAFDHLDKRLLALQLVKLGLTKAAMFDTKGRVVQPAEMLYRRPVIVERGTFCPPTKLHVHMLEQALDQFQSLPANKGKEPVVLLEMNLKNLASDPETMPQEFLDHADVLSGLGHPILISNYYRHFRLANYISQSTNQAIGFVMGVPGLAELFEDKYYTDLPGGILEAVGRMFKNDLIVYGYPTRDRTSQATITAETLEVAPHLRHLYSHLTENKRIVPIQSDELEEFDFDASALRESIQRGDGRWEAQVPESIADRIKETQAYGYAKKTSFLNGANASLSFR